MGSEQLEKIKKERNSHDLLLVCNLAATVLSGYGVSQFDDKEMVAAAVAGAITSFEAIRHFVVGSIVLAPIIEQEEQTNKHHDKLF